MKKILLSLGLIILMITFVEAQQPKVYVDERTELMSIVFRLVGAHEHVNEGIGVVSYDQEIDSIFASFKTHQLIEYAAQLREKYGIGYDAVMNYAILIEIKNGVITFKKDVADNALDKRWGDDSAEEFLKLLNIFYQESDFHAFFERNHSLYTLIEDRFSEVLKTVDFSWFEKYYGVKSEGEFHLIPSLCNGWGGYGPSIEYKDGRKDVYAILGFDEFDSLGYPTYSIDMMEMVIHEYNHSFCNPLIDTFFPQMEKGATNFFKLVEQQMSDLAYGNAFIMMCEYLVRASVIQYTLSIHGDITQQLQYEKSNGFLFIDSLVQLLSQYEQQRSQYASLKDFMPEVANLVNRLSPKDIYSAYMANSVRITGTSIKNNSKKIAPGIIGLTIYFEKPMDGCCYGLSYGRGKDFFPEIVKNEKYPSCIQTRFYTPL